MAWRNRTSLFLRLREESRLFQRAQLGKEKRQRRGDDGAKYVALQTMDEAGSELDSEDDQDENDLEGGLARTGQVKAGFGGEPAQQPSWMAAVNAIREELAALRDNIEQLRVLHREHLLPGFGDDAKREEERRINALVYDITRRLRALERSVRALAGRGTADGRDDVLANLQRTFGTQLQRISADFRMDQKRYLRQLQSQQQLVLGTAAGASPNSGAFAESSLLPADGGGRSELVLLDDSAGSDGATAFAQVQLMEAEDAHRMVDTRAREIDAVASSIQDLAFLMKDLSQLVVEQGTVLDRIDYNIEAAKVSAQGATRELVRAERSQRSRRSASCIVCLTVACGIVAILLILKWIF